MTKGIVTALGVFLLALSPMGDVIPSQIDFPQIQHRYLDRTVQKPFAPGWDCLAGIKLVTPDPPMCIIPPPDATGTW
jgi:hypothetical protein